MKVKINDIPEGGLEINADYADNKWLKELFVDIFGRDKMQDDDGGRISLMLQRNYKDVTVVGGAVFKWHPSCDRCLGEYQKHEQVAIYQFMKPASKADKNDADVDEDEDFGIYHGKEIDIAELVREYLILSRDMVNLCKDECKGLCHKCGMNLNEGLCGCPVEQGDSTFAPLKNKLDV